MLRLLPALLPLLLAPALLGDMMPPPLRRLLRILGMSLGVLGLLAFISQFIIAGGVLGQMRSIAFPVGQTHLAIALPDGRYAVPLDHIDRIQIYSHDLQFEHGFQVPAAGGPMTLLPGQGGQLEVYANRGRRHLVYTPDGTLQSSGTYDERTNPPPAPERFAKSPYIPAPWWSFPFRGPFYAWATAAVGFLLVFATRTLEQKLAERRAKQHPYEPKGPVGKTIKAICGGIALVVWTGIGFVWFFGCLFGEVRALSERNWFAALLMFPFLLIGCGLLLISLMLLRTTFGIATDFLRRQR